MLSALLVVSLLALPLAGCAKPLTLKIWDSQDGAAFTDSPVYVKGKVSDGKATVRVNDDAVWKNAKTGEFQGSVHLTEGENIINIVAQKNKTVTTKTVTITYQPEKQATQEIEQY